jgi:hypothetical protein
MNRYFPFGVNVLIAIAALLVIADAEKAAGTGFSLDGANQFGLLYEGNGGHNFAYNNSNINGNIGIGGTGHFQGNGPGTINGLIQFSASNSGQYSNSGLTLSPSSGNPVYNVSSVTSALNTVNTLSHDLGLELGTTASITSGGSLSASSGSLDGNGNRIFTVTAISFANGTFTVNGGPNDFVVLNVADGVGTNGLNGSIVLTGGITSDQVLINYTPSTSNLTNYNNAYTNLTGGPTLTISTNGLTTSGTFLDPTGNFSVNHSDVMGRVIGGDSTDSSFQSGASLTAPAPTPEPGTLILLATAALGAGAIGWRRHRQNVSLT